MTVRSVFGRTDSFTRHKVLGKVVNSCILYDSSLRISKMKLHTVIVVILLGVWQVAGQQENGLTGATGLRGPSGSPGPAGESGPVGPRGEVGPPGPSGPAGPSGNAGKVGQSGPPGRTGTNGLRGFPGLQGATGARGRDGRDGPTNGGTGATGLVGPVGRQGYPGPAGAPGISYTGSESGRTGSTGATGQAGYPGPVGVPGMRGAPGYPGPSGPAGLTGFAGPPGPPGQLLYCSNQHPEACSPEQLAGIGANNSTNSAEYYLYKKWDQPWARHLLNPHLLAAMLSWLILLTICIIITMIVGVCCEKSPASTTPVLPLATTNGHAAGQAPAYDESDHGNLVNNAYSNINVDNMTNSLKRNGLTKV